MLQISDADIARAEGILLPAGCTFNEERRNFIRCMESRDVVACPGSGKTTALLAKLLILAQYMPFPDGRGVCVLTHTNVAINEIKKRAGAAADSLFCHPTYFGTIQGFVNRFLAVPAYRNIYKQPVQAIDNDRFFGTLRSRYEHDVGLQKWLEPRGGVGTLGGYWFKPSDLSIGRNMDDDISKLKRSTPTYGKIEGIRNTVLGKGILSYNDAYSLGLNYLLRYPNIAKAIRHRFRFIFIDEMQDTDDHQLRVLDKLFARRDSVVLQRLGDPNQAIYQSDVKQGMLWSPTDPFLPFSDSLRYGASIAKVLDTVRIDRALTLAPNHSRASRPPHLLLFDSGNEEAVLPAFGKLIREYGLHELESPSFKAVGWLGKDKRDEGKACLSSYHQDYQKSLVSKGGSFLTLVSYLHAADIAVQGNPRDAGHISALILRGLVRALRLAGLSHPKTSHPFTSVTLNSYLKLNEEKLYTTLRHALADWILRFCRSELTAEQLRDAIAALVRKRFAVTETAELTEFLDSDAVDFKLPQAQTANTFVSDAGDMITVGTVHSVKGETHTATLYLETFNYALDSKRLLPFCCGEYDTTAASKPQHRGNLKVAHVAFSRPTHLLTFACGKQHLDGQVAKLKDAGWVIREIVNEETNDDPF